MNNPKVTIITVSYNAVETIEKTIKSVIDQTYNNIEYIIIDGGSKDGTVNIIKKYSAYITKWISEPDKGIYFAMNKGIILASGEWIHFKNCGDYFTSNEVLSSVFNGHNYQGIDIVHGNCIYFNSWGYRVYKPAILHKSYKESMPIIHSASFIKSDLHKNFLFNTIYKSSADYDFFYRCFEMKIKDEYIDINVSLFNQIGFSTQNRNLAIKENYKIQGKDKTILGKIFIEVKLLNRKINISMKNIFVTLFDRNGHIKRSKMINNGWCEYPLPVNLMYTK